MEASESGQGTSVSFYLMKAEPDSRIEKGKDVKFSVDDFESVKITAWEGVRNYEARNIMQEMKIGDKVLFYHSNTKNPGIAGFAEVSKQAYPDYTAWDETHPYYDAKTNASAPRWYMVDLRFVSRAAHFVPLSLLRHLATLSESPAETSYLDNESLKAIKNMALLNKGRLSVQRVEEEAWDAISKIADKGYNGVKLWTKRTTNNAQTQEEAGSDRASGEGGTERGKGKRKGKEPKETQSTRRSKRIRR